MYFLFLPYHVNLLPVFFGQVPGIENVQTFKPVRSTVIYVTLIAPSLSANCQLIISSQYIPLARVFNLSLKDGVVPFEWKEANIISLCKKGSRNKSENYRPVSLKSVICKVLERLIKDHMVDFVKHKLLNLSQHGFLKARSCLTNMLGFWEKSLSG